MFLLCFSRITASRYIAVKWYLRVYWLLPLSIVASFKKNRRFFCLAPSILLLRIVASFGKHRRSFAEHHEYLGQSINFISQRIHFQTSPDSFSLHQLNQQTTWQKSYWLNRHLPTRPSSLFCWQNGYVRLAELESFVGPYQDMSLLSWMTAINETKSLPRLVPYKKGNDSGICSTRHST